MPVDENKNGIKAMVKRNREDIQEVKTDMVRTSSELKDMQLRHKEEVLETMKTYMGNMSDIVSSLITSHTEQIKESEKRHQIDRQELKDDFKEIKRDNKEMLKKLYWVAGIIAAIGFFADKLI